MMGLPLHNPHAGRWMLFVDGENFTMSAQRFAARESVSLLAGKYHVPDVFVWIPGVRANDALVWGGRGGAVPMQPQAIRAYYYTSVVGDDQCLAAVRESLWELGFSPEVFKRKKGSQHLKGVDITMAKDVLAHAYRDNYDAAVLVAGDGDFVPLVDEVRHLGKVVRIAFFSGADIGLNPALRLASDTFHELNSLFLEQWQGENVRQNVPDGAD